MSAHLTEFVFSSSAADPTTTSPDHVFSGILPFLCSCYASPYPLHIPLSPSPSPQILFHNHQTRSSLLRSSISSSFRPTTPTPSLTTFPVSFWFSPSLSHMLYIAASLVIASGTRAEVMKEQRCYNEREKGITRGEERQVRVGWVRKRKERETKTVKAI